MDKISLKSAAMYDYCSRTFKLRLNLALRAISVRAMSALKVNLLLNLCGNNTCNNLLKRFQIEGANT